MGKFTAIQTYDRFTKLKNANKINEHSLNFILDTGQLYTHGIFLNNVAWGTETTGAVELTIAGVKKTLSLSSHTHSNYLEKNANINLGAYKIVSGTKDLLYYSSGNTYLGNTSSPLILQGSSGSIKKGDTTYTILDTLNFTILAVSSAGHYLQNAAKITYGSSNFLIDYIKRLNTTLAFNDLNAYSNAGVTFTSSKYYGFLTLCNDGSDNANWALLRIDIASKTLLYRTSSDISTWYNAITSIPVNALNTAGIVTAPSVSDANKFWRTDSQGNPSWGNPINTTAIKLGSAGETNITDSTVISAESSNGIIFQGGTNSFKVGNGTNSINISVSHGLSTKNININGSNYAIYTSASSLPTFLAPTSYGSANQILATNSSKNGLTWVAKPTSNVTTTAVISDSSTGKNNITANQSDPYYNLIEGSTVTRSILFKGGSGISINSSNGIITFDNVDISITSTLSNVDLTSLWSNVEDLTTKLENNNGSYIILIIYGSRIYTGYFSYVSDSSGIEEEILLHCSGKVESSPLERGRLYAKIGLNSSKVYLQLATTLNESNATVTIKYKKVL